MLKVPSQALATIQALGFLFSGMESFVQFCISQISSFGMSKQRTFSSPAIPVKSEGLDVLASYNGSRNSKGWCAVGCSPADVELFFCGGRGEAG